MANKSNTKCDDWIHERNLGSGGFGIVELWRNCRSGDKIAIKRCKDASSLSEKQKSRWNHEVLIMKHLNHPNLVSSVEVPKELITVPILVPVLCMEYCNRGDLRKFLNNPKYAFGIEQLKAIKIMSDIAFGVEFLHLNKITHRDLKPENIVMHERNGKITFKLIDLGYAKELGQDSLYASLVGTLNYVAPELFWDKKYSCTVDYWSLGILFYEILTGTRPFLPHMKHTETWMNAVRNKRYEQICAQQIEGQIHFYTDIADPTDLSESTRRKIVEWFRIALQWDPKKRGKSPDSNEVILFSMWRSILSEKELHVFVASQYRIITYPINEKNTLENLKQWIQEKTEIPGDQQTITTFDCKILNNKESIISQVDIQSEVPHVIVFKSGNLHFGKLPHQNLPKSIERILPIPNKMLDYHERIQYIKDIMFFINQEIKLSKWYQIALSIKIDLLDQRFITLDESMKTAIENISLLKSEVEGTLKNEENQITQKQERAIKSLNEKIEEKLLKAIIQMTKKSEILKEVNEELKKFSEVNWTNDFSTLFDEVVEVFKNEDHTLAKARVESTTKLLFRFLELKSSNIENNEDILKTTRSMSYLENELSKLEKLLNSANILKNVYNTEYKDLNTLIDNPNSLYTCESKSEPESDLFSIATSLNNSLKTSLNSESGNQSDNLIRDSLVIRHMMTNLVTKLQRKKPSLLSLDL